MRDWDFFSSQIIQFVEAVQFVSEAGLGRCVLSHWKVEGSRSPLNTPWGGAGEDERRKAWQKAFCAPSESL